MIRRASVLQAARAANRIWTGWPVEVCAPLLVLNVAVWAMGAMLQEALTKSLSTLLLGIVAVACLVLQEWAGAVVVRVGYLRGVGDGSAVGWGQVLGWKRLKGTVAALGLRYFLWFMATLAALALVWSVGMAVWFMAHHRPLSGSSHDRHPFLVWVFLQLWILSTYVFLSRYQFVLPLIGIAGEVPSDVIRDAVKLAKANWGAVVPVTLLEELVLMVPIAALLHFLRPVLLPIRFAYGGLELVTTVFSAFVATWFLLVKLDLARQALQVRESTARS